MGRQKREWFLVRGQDVKPDTTITLGKLIVDKNNAEGPPYFDKALPVAAEDLTDLRYPWSLETEKSRGGKLGLFASVLALAGVGGDASGNLLVGQSQKTEVEELQTLKFQPSDDYVERTMNLPSNRATLFEIDHWKPVFIVTGVKIAYRAKVTKSNWKDWGGDGSVSVSPHAPGVTVGPNVSYTHHTKTTETAGGSHDFVWAFLLNKVHYSKEKKKFVQTKHVRGAGYSLEDGGDPQIEVALPIEDADSTVFEDIVEVHGVERASASASDFGVDGTVVFDEENGEECILVP